MSHPALTSCLCLLLAAVCVVARAAPTDGQTFKDWTARCDKAPEGGRPVCYIVQHVLLKKGNQPLLQVSVGNMADGGKPAAFFSLPLGVSLPGGLSVKVDEAQPLRLRYERCDRAGCHAPLALDDDLIKALKGGRWARVAFFDATRREVSVPVSLAGFTAGFDSLR